MIEVNYACAAQYLGVEGNGLENLQQSISLTLTAVEQNPGSFEAVIVEPIEDNDHVETR